MVPFLRRVRDESHTERFSLILPVKNYQIISLCLLQLLISARLWNISKNTFSKNKKYMFQQ